MRALFGLLDSQSFVLLFLVVGVGYVLGRLRIGGLALGTTPSTVIFGLLLSLLAEERYGFKYHLAPLASSMFFNMFIYAVGLRIGPQFFASLERGGKKLIVVALVVSVGAPALALLCACLFGLPFGGAAGLLAGSCTSSAALGGAQSALANARLVGPALEHANATLSAAFAVTYIVGMVGFIIFIKYLPALFRIDVQAATRELEAELRARAPSPLPGTVEALHARMPSAADIRVFRVDNPGLHGRLSGRFDPWVVVEGVRRGGDILALEPGLAVCMGDLVALAGRVQHLLGAPRRIGPEVDDPELRAVPLDSAEVVINRGPLIGRTLDEVMRGPGHGLHPVGLFRMGEQIPAEPSTELKRGDVLRVIGSKRHVAAFENEAGAAVRAQVATDILTLATGLVLGVLLGAVKIPIFHVELSLGTAGGVLLAAIAVGTLRARNPLLGGPFPEPARRMVEDIGLNVFVAVLGVNTGANVTSTMSGGALGTLLLSAALVGILPPVVGWAIGVYGLKLNPVVLLGAISGARQNTAALRVSEEETRSAGPALGFPVPFAVSTLVMTVLAYVLTMLT
jgi:putative transport protein